MLLSQSKSILLINYVAQPIKKYFTNKVCYSANIPDQTITVDVIIYFRSVILGFFGLLLVWAGSGAYLGISVVSP